MLTSDNEIQLTNFGMQLQNFGMQISIIGNQIPNMMKDLKDQMISIAFQISNIGMKIFNIGLNLKNKLMQRENNIEMENPMKNFGIFNQNFLGINNINSINESNIKNENKIISIIFQISNGRKVTINASPENTLEELINLFIEKIGQKPGIDNINYTFIFNGQTIQSNNKTKIREFRCLNNVQLIQFSIIIAIPKSNIY